MDPFLECAVPGDDVRAAGDARPNAVPYAGLVPVELSDADVRAMFDGRATGHGSERTAAAVNAAIAHAALERFPSDPEAVAAATLAVFRFCRPHRADEGPLVDALGRSFRTCYAAEEAATQALRAVLGSRIAAEGAVADVLAGARARAAGRWRQVALGSAGDGSAAPPTAAAVLAAVRGAAEEMDEVAYGVVPTELPDAGVREMLGAVLREVDERGRCCGWVYCAVVHAALQRFPHDVGIVALAVDAVLNFQGQGPRSCDPLAELAEQSLDMEGVREEALARAEAPGATEVQRFLGEHCIRTARPHP
jgi:hypothetical protein